MNAHRKILLLIEPLDEGTPCSYCRLPFGRIGLGSRGFEVDHIKPKSRYPELADTATNLAWACVRCNGKKSDHVDGFDPETSEFLPLFHPNRERWGRHFWGRSDGKIHRITATGRATGERLKLNAEPILLEFRSDGYAAGWWPA